MPTRRALTLAELRNRQRTVGVRLDPYQEYTFLDDNDRALLSAADERGDSIEEFTARLSATDMPEADRNLLSQELDSRRRRAAARTRTPRQPRQGQDDESSRGSASAT